MNFYLLRLQGTHLFSAMYRMYLSEFPVLAVYASIAWEARLDFVPVPYPYQSCTGSMLGSD